MMKLDLSLKYYRVLLLFTFFQKCVDSLKCHQCNGWNGDYPPGKNSASTCANRNNQCSTTQFCVKIIDPMDPGVKYVTYKSDCYYQTTLQVDPANLSYVASGGCYPFQDGSTPAKRWWYCFCNDRDYCNGSNQNSILALFFVVISSFAYLLG